MRRFHAVCSFERDGPLVRAAWYRQDVLRPKLLRWEWNPQLHAAFSPDEPHPAAISAIMITNGTAGIPVS